MTHSNSNKNKALQIDDGKIIFGSKAIKFIINIFIAAFIAVTVGGLALPISNEILGINKQNLSPSDFPFQRKVGADNEAIRINYIKSQSMKNVKIVTVVTFFIALGIIFIRVEKADNNSNSE